MESRRRKAFAAARGQLPIYLPRVAQFLRRQAEAGGYYHDYSEFKLLEIYFMLERMGPRVILELGGGSTTAAFAEYAHRHPGTLLVSVDESEQYLDQTRARLDDAVRPAVRFALCPRVVAGQGDGSVCYYDPRYRELLGDQRRIGLCYVDGPSAMVPDSRQAVPCIDCVRLLEDGYRIDALAFDSRTMSVRYLLERPAGLQYDYLFPKPMKGEARDWWVRPVRRHTWAFLRLPNAPSPPPDV